MTQIFAESALLPTGWARNIRISCDGGSIVTVETDANAQDGDERCAILLPAMPNLHSHAFQRGMAGLAEIRGEQADSFWSWREVMYRFALTMTPEQVEAVAAQLYVEMLEAGFSRVGEFHYLHHDHDGRHYANIAEMGERIAAAASRTGIGLTLLPVFYAHSTFDGAAPNDGQRRFINDPDSFGRLLEACRAAAGKVEGSVVGVAPHSLRAVTPEELAMIAAMAGDAPIHIHAAEQVKEVEDCILWSGTRPVEWLLANVDVDRHWCLIHATHMTDEETSRLAASGAVAGLCPITEANLGDGTFPAPQFVKHGGRFGIGSDSNVLIGITDELRQLEYSQTAGASRAKCACRRRRLHRPRAFRCRAGRRRCRARRRYPTARDWSRRRFHLARRTPSFARRQDGRRYPRRLDFCCRRQDRLRLGSWKETGRKRMPSSKGRNRCEISLNNAGTRRSIG